MGRRKKMDNLAREAMLAMQAGMSYGKWKAMQEPVAVGEKPIPDGWQKCEKCGKPFKSGKGKRFCDEICRRTAYDESGKQKEYMRKYRESKRCSVR